MIKKTEELGLLVPNLYVIEIQSNIGRLCGPPATCSGPAGDHFI